MVKSPARPEGSPTLARREQIIEAGRAVIEEHGPEALTDQIAQRAGLARPNVYRHFASKEELDLEVARNAYQELRAAVLTKMDACATPLDAIRAAISAQVIWADKHRNLYRFLVSRSYQPSSRGRRAERRDFAADVVAAGTRYFPQFAEDPESAATLVVSLGGLLDASILAWLSRRSESRKKLIDRLTQHACLIVDHHLREQGVEIDLDVPLSLPGPKSTR